MKKLSMRGKYKLFFLFLIFIFILIRLYIDHFTVKNTKYIIYSSKIPNEIDGFKIIQLSDLHGVNLKSKITNIIDSEKPNIIVMTGDMISASHTDFTNFYNLTKELVKKYSVYYIKGNHEGRMYKYSYEVIEKTLKSFGVIVLDNEKARIENNNKYINLYGMWVNQRFYSRLSNNESNVINVNNIEKLLGKCNKEEYNILLIHTPKFFEAYSKWGADLVLAGHIHGGLIRIPFLGGLISPYLELFPKYCYGKYDIDNSTMIVNSGLSRPGAGIRFFNRPEIVTIELKSNIERK